jgi:hypothetical protein
MPENCGYLPWREIPDTPLPIRECFHYFDGNGYCENGMSPHAGRPCPWHGEPEEEQD